MSLSMNFTKEEKEQFANHERVVRICKGDVRNMVYNKAIAYNEYGFSDKILDNGDTQVLISKNK